MPQRPTFYVVRCLKWLKDVCCDLSNRILQFVASVGDINEQMSTRDHLNGFTPLMLGVCDGSMDEVLLALLRGADPSVKNTRGLTAHQLAIRKRQTNMASLISIFDKNIATDFTSAQIRVAIHKLFEFAALYNLISIIELIQAANVPLDIPDMRGRTPMHVAAEKCRMEIMRLLSKAGADINARIVSTDSFNGSTPLMLAADHGRTDVVSLALMLGADASLTNANGLSAYKMAVEKKHSETASLLAVFDKNVTPDFTAEPIRLAVHRLYSFVYNYQLEGFYHLLMDASAFLDVQKEDGSTLLHLAVKHSRHQDLKALLNAGANPDIQDNQGCAPIHLACKQTDDCTAHVQTEDESTFFYLVVKNECYHDLKALLNAGANPNIQDNQGCAPIHLACQVTDDCTVQELIDAHASVNLQDSLGRTPVHIAVEKNRVIIFRMLRDAGAPFNIPDHKGRIPLHVAMEVENSYSNVMKQVIDASLPYLNFQDLQGRTPMHIAVEKNSSYSVKLLQDAGASFEVRDKLGFMPAHIAAKKGCFEILELAVEAGFNIDEHVVSSNEFNGYTCLMLAAEQYPTEAVLTALLLGADVSLTNARGQTAYQIAAKKCCYLTANILAIFDKTVIVDNCTAPIPAVVTELLTFALRHRHTKLVQLLLDHDIPLNLQDHSGRTIMHVAVEINFYIFIRQLGEISAPLSTPDNDGITPMHLAAQIGKSGIIQLLAETGVDVNQRVTKTGKFNGYTPLMFAAEHNQLEAVSMLLHMGANVTLTNKKGETACELASQSYSGCNIYNLLSGFDNPYEYSSCEFTSAVLRLIEFANYRNFTNTSKLLQEARAPLNIPNHDGLCLIHVTADRGWCEIMEQLTEAGIDINTPVKSTRYMHGDWTPLHFAVQRHEFAAAETALKLGADVNAVTANGETAVSMVLARDKKEFIQRFTHLLLHAGAAVDHVTARISPLVPSDVIRAIVPEDTPFWLAANNDAPMLAAELAGGLDPNMKTENGMTLLHWVCAGDAPECVQLLLEAGADPTPRAVGHDLVQSYCDSDGEYCTTHQYILKPWTYANFNSPESLKILKETGRNDVSGYVDHEYDYYD